MRHAARIDLGRIVIADGQPHRSALVRLRADLTADLAALVADGAEHLHRWPGGGISWVRVGCGGTVVVHTWPEHGIATIDVYGQAALEACRAILAEAA